MATTIFEKTLDRIFLSPTEKVQGDLNSYINAIESGAFLDKVCYGISDADKGFFTVDPVQRPGALYCGGMGSGKSIAMRFTVVTHLATNSLNTFYIFFDALKNMTDYVQLFQDKVDDFGNIIEENPYKKNIVAAIGDTAKIVPVIDMLFEECMVRKEEFSRVGANNVYSYDKIMKEKNSEHKGVARIMVCIEEFHAIPVSPQVKFNMKVDQEGSVANKFQKLMRVGRSYGVFFLFATQKATSEDVPSQLKPGLSMMMAFRLNSQGDASAMNLPHAIDIGMKQLGRCAYDGGYIQYPYISNAVLKTIMDKYYKPLEAKLLAFQPEDYHKALTGEGNDGMVWIKPYKDIVKFANQFDFRTIAKRILKSFNIEVENQNNEAFVAEMIGTKYDNRYAIKLIKNREQGGKKEIDALIKGAEALNCNKILILISEVPAPMAVTALERSPDAGKSIIIDNDDLIQIANMLDSKDELVNKGKFSEFYMRYAIADERDLLTNKEPVVEPIQNKNEIIIEETVKVEKLEIVEKTEEAVIKKDVVIPKVEENHQDELRNSLKKERELYKQKIKEERKRFLEQMIEESKEPVVSPVIEESQEKIAKLSASNEEKIELQNEQDREDSSQETIDVKMLIELRNRLKQNIIESRKS